MNTPYIIPFPKIGKLKTNFVNIPISQPARADNSFNQPDFEFFQSSQHSDRANKPPVLTSFQDSP